MSKKAASYPLDYVSRPESACSMMQGMELKGTKATWMVVKKIERKKNSSGGNFSVGYIVRDQTGREAFIKATDTGLITGTHGADALDKLDSAIAEHKFERQILDFCQGNNMDRIVHAIDYGQTQVVFDGAREWVFFIVFELAQGDVRSAAIKEEV